MAKISVLGGRVLDRYLYREVLQAWAAVMLILLAIMLATRFASFLGMAAKGDIPRELLLEVAGLSSLRYLVILMPASLLLAILLSLGRLYSDNEIAAMAGCGVGLGQLYRPLLSAALTLTVLTAALAFAVGPWAGREADYLVKDARRLIQYTPFEPTRFKSVANGRAVFYTSDMDASGQHLGMVFAEVDRNGTPSIVVAPSGQQIIDPDSGDRLATLENGFRYTGTPGQADFEVIAFRELRLRVSPPPLNYMNDQRKLASTLDLVGSANLGDRAELQGRLAMPLCTLILALLAAPLAHLGPRQGRYSRVGWGLLAYLIYQNLIGLGQQMIAHGRMPPGIGLWWVHMLALAVAVVLIGRRQGWVRSPA